MVTIPSQLVEAFDIQTGDEVEIIPLSNGKIKIKKYNQDIDIKKTSASS